MISLTLTKVYRNNFCGKWSRRTWFYSTALKTCKESKTLLNVTSFRPHPDIELGPGKYFISFALSCPCIVTRGPDPAHRMLPPALWLWSCRGWGAAVWEGRAAEPVQGLPASPTELGSCSSSLQHRVGGLRRAREGKWLWGLGPKHRPHSHFSQDWATLSRFNISDRTPAFWWTAQKYLKMSHRSQKVPCDDPFSPFPKFRLMGAHCQVQHLTLPRMLWHPELWHTHHYSRHTHLRKSSFV